MGIIDEEGDLLDRGRKWHVPASYPEACDEILADVYPPDLASFVDANGEADVTKVASWFQMHGFGSSNARSMAGATRSLPIGGSRM